jgi:hypothetical protein
MWAFLPNHSKYQDGSVRPLCRGYLHGAAAVVSFPLAYLRWDVIPLCAVPAYLAILWTLYVSVCPTSTLPPPSPPPLLLGSCTVPPRPSSITFDSHQFTSRTSAQHHHSSPLSANHTICRLFSSLLHLYPFKTLQARSPHAPPQRPFKPNCGSLLLFWLQTEVIL